MPARATRGRLICRGCRHQCSVTAGTIFDKTRTPLRVWFAAAWYLTSQKQGVSALGLQRVLGLTSYQTAWAILHRFRRAMVRPDRDLLSGTVEVDEAYLALRRGAKVRRKGARYKTLSRDHLVAIAVAVEVLQPKGFGRIRLRRIEAPTIEALTAFVRENVEPGATVRTDGSPIYLPLVKRRVRSRSVRHLGFKHPGSQTIARRASHRLLTQTLAAWHPPWRSRSSTRRLLPRRIHLPL